MTRKGSSLLALLTLLGLGLAGCSTTQVDDSYSSVPPPGRMTPSTAPSPKAQARNSVAPLYREFQHLPPGEYADLLDRIREGYALPDVQHFAVDREIEGYRAKPDFLDRTFRRGARYLYYIVTEIERRGMPLELALLPVVESAFNPVAYSRSRASGLWQFIPSTGKHYGLQQNWWIDERRDVIRATNAALDYLQYLNRYFNGDWFLAIASYNGGEGTVSRAVARNAEQGRPTDFFSLDLRAETRDYVPKLLAISRIVGDPTSYGLQFAAIPNQPYFDIVDPGRQIDIGEAAVLAGITRDDMFALNPAFNRMSTPPDGPHKLLIPVDRAEPFRQALLTDDGTAKVAALTAAAEAAAMAPQPKTTTHRVRRGESLTTIARRYDVATSDIRAANNLHGSVIQPGQTLVIPRGSAAGSGVTQVAEARPEIAAQLPERQAEERREPAEKPKARVHVVRSGDTLYGVARRYGVSIPELAAANGMSSKSHLTAGERLEIPGKSGSASAGKPGAAKESTRMTYQVRNGDTLSEIADRFNVSVTQLKSWNRMRQSTSLKAGQKLVVYADPRKVNGG
jgi:membrane-bound lytic murein transglycosylase D